MAPEASAIGFALVGAADKPVMIYFAGDSTDCDQTDTDYAGWGQMLPQFFAPPAGIANYADSGESSGSFLNSSREWTVVKNAMVAGDWVLIQFGHNDGATTSATFQANITQMVKDAKAKGATPILVSPPARATFSGADAERSIEPSRRRHAGGRDRAERRLHRSHHDHHHLVQPDGPERLAGSIHALGTDKTHTNAAGAAKIAGFVRALSARRRSACAQYLRK